VTAPVTAAPTRRPDLARAALTIAVITVAARVVGFLRILVFARTVGPSCLGDTYYTANTVPNILFDLVAGGALASIVVPVLAGPVDRGDRAAADRTSSALLTWSVLLGRAGCPAGRRSVDGHCHRACGAGHHGEPGWVCRSHGKLPVYSHDHRVCRCVTNCVTITTYDHGLRWILRDA